MAVQIILDDQIFFLVHRTNKKIKKISLELQNKDEIIVKTPLKFKSHMLKEIVFEHKDWILRSLHKVPYKNQFDFITGGTVPFLGQNYPIELIEDESIKNVKFEFYTDHFKVYCTSISTHYDQFLDGLKKFYKFNAIKIIDPIFDEWTYKTQLFPNKIGYRYAKSRWGSCSYKNDISINYKLLQFEKKAIEYVVLHELCHIEHKNHSKKFWDLVHFYMNDYKSVENILKSKLF